MNQLKHSNNLHDLSPLQSCLQYTTMSNSLGLVKLAVNGSNWFNFRDHLLITIKIKQLTLCITFDTIPLAYTNADVVNNLKPAEHWEINQAITRHIIVSVIHNLAFLQVKHNTTINGLWDDLKALYKGKSQSLIIDLLQTLQQKKCEENESLPTHFDSLTNLCEQLAAIG